jgi:uncharacterized protein (DUF486 family)
MKNFFEKLNDTDIRHIAAIVIILGVFGILILQHFVTIPANNLQTVQRSTDQLLALGFGVVVGFLFMDSKKSKSDDSNKEEA